MRGQPSPLQAAAPCVAHNSPPACPNAAAAVPAVPQRGALIWPAAGRFATFTGDQVHSVLESGFGGRRLTFLINWWALMPEGLSRLAVSDAPSGFVSWPEIVAASLAEAPEPRPLPKIYAPVAGAGGGRAVALSELVALPGGGNAAALTAVELDHTGYALHQASDRRLLLLPTCEAVVLGALDPDPQADQGEGGGGQDSRLAYYDRMLADPELPEQQRAQFTAMRAKRRARLGANHTGGGAGEINEQPAVVTAVSVGFLRPCWLDPWGLVVKLLVSRLEPLALQLSGGLPQAAAVRAAVSQRSGLAMVRQRLFSGLVELHGGQALAVATSSSPVRLEVAVAGGGLDELADQVRCQVVAGQPAGGGGSVGGYRPLALSYESDIFCKPSPPLAGRCESSEGGSGGGGSGGGGSKGSDNI